MKRYQIKSFSLILSLFIIIIIFQTFYMSTICAQEDVIRIYKFEKVKGITIPIRTKESFRRLFAENPLVPTTNEGILQLANQLYTIEGRDEINETCGERLNGALFAGLSNPEISDNIRAEIDNIMFSIRPELPLTYIGGHFKFYYTTTSTDSRDNVTLADIKATDKILDDAWDDYAKNFTEPKHYLTGGGCVPVEKLIDVDVYYLGTSLYGQTSSYWDYMDLCSDKVVKSSCDRQTTPVHELFHRVQYSYDYISGTANMLWAVEGTASWSQKYRASSMGDWMDRMDEGLTTPDVNLIKNRSYDACHFWCYMGQRGKGEMPIIKQVWTTFQSTKNMKKAVESTINAKISNVSTLDEFVAQWTFANYNKDMTNANALHDYKEDEWTRTCGGITYGTLTNVVRDNRFVTVGTNITINGSVTPYGADYYNLNLDIDAGDGTVVSQVQISVTTSPADRDFSFATIEVLNSSNQNHEITKSGLAQFNRTFTFTPGDLTDIVLIVVGNPGGGEYTVTITGS